MTQPSDHWKVTARLACEKFGRFEQVSAELQPWSGPGKTVVKLASAAVAVAARMWSLQTGRPMRWVLLP